MRTYRKLDWGTGELGSWVTPGRGRGQAGGGRDRDQGGRCGAECRQQALTGQVPAGVDNNRRWEMLTRVPGGQRCEWRGVGRAEVTALNAHPQLEPD